MKTTETKTQQITRLAIVAALYVALTIAFSFVSFGSIQFRISEMLVLLCFFRKDYSISMIIGCILANLFSPYGIVDIIFGTLATTAACLMICYCKNIFIAIIPPVLCNGLIVGAEIAFIEDIPFYLPFLSVAAGEAAVIIVGAVIFYYLAKKNSFRDLIKANQNIPQEDETTNY